MLAPARALTASTEGQSTNQGVDTLNANPETRPHQGGFHLKLFLLYHIVEQNGRGPNLADVMYKKDALVNNFA